MPDGASTINMEGSARFIFVNSKGYITAWTDRRQDTGGTLRNDGPSQQVYPAGGAVATGDQAFFGVALKTETWDTLWVVDFGMNPKVLQFDAGWNLVPTVGFTNPFATGAGGIAKPGDFVPFNIISLGSRVFVTYAKSQVSANDLTAFRAGEEDSLDADLERSGGYQPDRGRLVEYKLNGELVRIYKDDKRLNSPWGVAIAPASFGAFGNSVLVGNFGGAGLIAGFSSSTGEFLGYLRDTTGGFVAQPGLWGLQFGNGVSLGDVDALYFAAGPEGETAGLFGSLRYMPR